VTRIRSLKPENWKSRSVGGVSRDARLLCDVLITMADADGRWKHLPASIIGHGYPRDEEVSARLIRKWSAELVDAELIVLYEVDGDEYGCFPKWHLHQVINHYSPSRLPIPPDVSWIRRDEASRIKKGTGREDSGSPTVALREASPPDQEDRVPFHDPDPVVVEIDARAHGAQAEKLRAVVEVLRQSKRLTFDPDCVAVANTIAAFPKHDHIAAAHLAVSRAADPSWRTLDAARTLEYVLKGLEPATNGTQRSSERPDYDKAAGLT